jgi:putative hydrolase of the HAD superfamily
MTSSLAMIFDFGGVISRTIFETHPMTERALGLQAGSLTWQGPFAPDTDTLWTAMQAGELSERDYWATRTREVGAMVGKDWTEMSQFVTAARGADPAAIIRPEALQAIEDLHAQGIPLAILSNELDLFYGPEFRGKLDFLQKFAVIADATYTGILKPDARAYLDCCSELKVDPKHCVFVDDQAINIRGAEALGMQTVHFDVRNPAASYQQAMNLVVNYSKEAIHA